MVACRAVDASFFTQAPQRLVFEAVLAASAAEVFALLEDGAAWPVWFAEIQEVTWRTPKPFRVGTRRTVRLTTMTVEETFFIWEPGRRFAFYFHEQSRRLTRAFAEDYQLTDLPDGHCRLLWQVCYEPAFPYTLVKPLLRAAFRKMFTRAAHDLAAYVAARSATKA